MDKIYVPKYETPALAKQSYFRIGRKLCTKDAPKKFARKWKKEGNGKTKCICTLGRAQSVGDSCYFVRMNGVNILLDAGAAVHEGQIEYPDYEYLLRAGILESFSEINLILISHAHRIIAVVCLC